MRPRLFGRKRPSPDAVKVPARFAFPVDDKLVSRQEAEAAKHPVNSIKRLILENPDTWVKPKHYTEVPF